MEDQTRTFHVPVLLNEVLAGFNVQKNAWYVDGTAGGGGHIQAITHAGGRVVAIDQDSAAIAELIEKFKTEIVSKRVVVREGNFRDLKLLVKDAGVDTIRGILLDLGLSTYQIKDSGRGFSFMRDEGLDMRMSSKTLLSAKEIIHRYSESALTEIFVKFGEEILAVPIARAIIEARRRKPITTSRELADIVKTATKGKYFNPKIHAATKVFQALRIAVNNELESLSLVMPDAWELLESGGRFAVINFHSLEDRIVKTFFRQMEKQNRAIIISKKPIRASEEEIYSNRLSHSAKLRIAEKI